MSSDEEYYLRNRLEWETGERVRLQSKTEALERSFHKDVLAVIREAAVDSRIKELQAEVEVWKGMVADGGVACNERARENRGLESENARLKAEVERLRKAGDAMAKAIRWLPQSISDHHLDAWNAAKEGKQS